MLSTQTLFYIIVFALHASTSVGYHQMHDLIVELSYNRR